MRISFWSDDVSRKLEGTNKNAARLWKASNLFGKLAFIGILFGVILLLIAASSQFFIEAFYQSSVGGDAKPMSNNTVGMAGALNQISDSLKAVLPVLALLFFILAGPSFLLYLISVAVLAFMFEDGLWGVFIGGGILFAPFSLLAPYYKNKKEKELLTGGKK
ncbi:MAG: hypothetical protein NT157_06180 [Candidatus Micrarchaeota archaeon]|nr:hypothetical protein [Candidatus Micrarchaeota archaeon]